MVSMQLALSEVEQLLGVAEPDEEGIANLEEFIIKCNTAEVDGEPLVEDSIYDRAVEILRTAKPDSDVLSELWDKSLETGILDEDLDIHLRDHPMLSIQTIKSWDDTKDFFDSIESNVTLFMSYKINGHGIRIVYQDGELVRATSRARNSGGRDLTKQCKSFCPTHIEAWEGCGVIEVRGEACLQVDKLDEVRTLTGKTLVSPFSAVSALIRPYATQEESSHLTFLAYRLFDGAQRDRSDEYVELEEVGFLTPDTDLIMLSEEEFDVDGSLRAGVEQSFHDVFEKKYSDGEFPYFCDGVVVEVDDHDIFEELGSDGSRAGGNIALKVGQWKQDQYTGIVQKIIWTSGKDKFSPVAIVASEPDKAMLDDEGNILNYEDLGVVVAQGNRVRRVPLYEPRNILMLDAYPGQPLSFRYGGEAGVVPCRADGSLLSDDAAKALLTN